MSRSHLTTTIIIVHSGADVPTPVAPTAPLKDHEWSLVTTNVYSASPTELRYEWLWSLMPLDDDDKPPFANFDELIESWRDRAKNCETSEVHFALNELLDEFEEMFQ